MALYFSSLSKTAEWCWIGLLSCLGVSLLFLGLVAAKNNWTHTVVGRKPGGKWYEDVKKTRPVAPFLFVSGSLLTAGSGVWFSLRKRALSLPRLTDSGFDELVALDHDALCARALRQCGVDRTALLMPPVSIRGPLYFPQEGTIGKDALFRPREAQCLILIPEQKALAVYLVDWSYARGTLCNERTAQFSYNSVVSFQIEPKAYPATYPTKPRDHSVEQKILDVFSIHNLSIEVAIPIADSSWATSNVNSLAPRQILRVISKLFERPTTE